ncbi:MAG: hypothetical protein R3B72_46090 [Polyangiaceae bacterium]
MSDPLSDCPWCGAAVGDPDALCASCGRSPAQHPSRKYADGIELDLDLDLGRGQRSSPAPASRPASGSGKPQASAPAKASAPPGRTSSSPPGGGGLNVGLAIDFDDDDGPPAHQGLRQSNAPVVSKPNAQHDGALGLFDDDVAGLDVGLDLGSVPPPGGHAMPAPAPIPAPAPAPRTDPGAAAEPAASPPAPPGSSASASTSAAPDAAPAAEAPRKPEIALPDLPDREQPMIDPERVERLAGYGPIPAELPLAPLYAITVLRRRYELKREVQQQKRLHDDTVRALREELADEVKRMLEGADGSKLDALKRELGAADAAYAEQGKAMDAAASAFASRFRGLDDELERRKRERQDAVRARDMATIQVEDARQGRSKVLEEKARIEGLLAVAHEEARAAAGEGAEYAPPGHAQKLQRLLEQQVEAEKRMSHHDRLLAEARRHLRARERAIRAIDDAVKQVHRKSAALEKEARVTHGGAIDALKAAQHERLDAYERGLLLLQAQHPNLIGREEQKRLHTIREQIEEADADLVAIEHAPRAYDDTSFKRGLAVLAVIGVIVLLLIGTVIRIAW